MPDDKRLPNWIDSLPGSWTAGYDRSVLEQARAAYDAGARRYHTWDHVVACVEHLRTFPCDNPRTVFLTLVFHDAIYVAGRTDNEVVSADLAREVLSTQPSISEAERAAIERMILATKNHHDPELQPDADTRALLDLDLSILGASRDEYTRYARAIRDEFVPAATTDARFRIGRITFLLRMLSRPFIYFTAEGRARWDAKARENILWECESLGREQGFLGRLITAIRVFRTI